jgi:hypothetical protein
MHPTRSPTSCAAAGDAEFDLDAVVMVGLIAG